MFELSFKSPAASTQPAIRETHFGSSAKKLQKLSCKYFVEKPILLNFVNASTVFYPILQKQHTMQQPRKVSDIKMRPKEVRKIILK